MGLLDYIMQQGAAAKQAASDKLSSFFSPNYWTPDAIGNRMVSGLQNAISDPSGLIGGGLGGTVESIGKFMRPAIFDAQGFHLPESSMQRLMSAAQSAGHDGIVFKNTLDGDIHQPLPAVNPTTIQILTKTRP